jgi:predicted HicB family RNase H-like nuclease
MFPADPSSRGVLQTPDNDMTDPAKNLTITLRLSPEEHAVWVDAATADGRTLSSWIRRQCAIGASRAKPLPTSTPRRKRKVR